jgi:hypothetical protein
MATQNLKPATTPLTEAQKRRKKTVGSAEKLAELKKKQLAAMQNRLGMLGGSQASERESLALKGQAAQQEMSRQAGKLYAQGVSASPFSGATARISAGAQVAEQTSRQQEEARLRQQAAEAQLRAGQRREMTAAEQAVAGAEEDVVVQEQQVTEVQQKLPGRTEQWNQNVAAETAEVNTIITNNENWHGDTEAEAAGQILARALTYKDTDPKLYKMLTYVAEAVRNDDLPPEFSATGGIGSGVSISLTEGSWPWNQTHFAPEDAEWDFATVYGY